MKITKQVLFLIIFVFLFNSANANPLISIQNCADSKESNKQSKSLNKWLAMNTYDEILKGHNSILNKHKQIINIIEEELNYLSKINFTELQDQHLENSLFLPFLTVLFANNQNNLKWDEFNENARLDKRIISDYFKDFKKTKSSLEKKLKTHQILETKEINKINELKKMGTEKYNVILNKKIKEKKQKSKNLLKKSLDVKMLKKSYNKYFFECEKKRVIAPITFDYTWK